MHARVEDVKALQAAAPRKPTQRGREREDGTQQEELITDDSRKTASDVHVISSNQETEIEPVSSGSADADASIDTRELLQAIPGDTYDTTPSTSILGEINHTLESLREWQQARVTVSDPCSEEEGEQKTETELAATGEAERASQGESLGEKQGAGGREEGRGVSGGGCLFASTHGGNAHGSDTGDGEGRGGESSKPPISGEAAGALDSSTKAGKATRYQVGKEKQEGATKASSNSPLTGTQPWKQLCEQVCLDNLSGPGWCVCLFSVGRHAFTLVPTVACIDM